MQEAVISVSGLSHSFGDGAARKTVLDGVSIDFFPGEIVIVMGPSGAGKTTLLTLVGALRSIQLGSVRVGAPNCAMHRPGSCGTCAAVLASSSRTTTWWRR